MLPWEQRFIRGAFRSGVVDSAISVARGNGKTSLVAGIAAASLDGPLHLPRGETILVASSFDQARISFEHILAFLWQRNDLSDKATWRIWDTAQQARIEHRPSGAKVKCVGSDPRRAHGLAPSLILMDEPAQWTETTGERMVAALTTAAGKQAFCRIIALGTRPSDAEHWFAKMLAGGADYFQCHAADVEFPKFHRRTWEKANPSMKYLPDLANAIQRESVKAKLDPSALASFESLRLNLGTSDVTRSVLLAAETWLRIEGQAEARGKCIWGIDLGTSGAKSL